MITSLLRLEARHAGDQRVHAAFDRIATRIHSMALVHRTLYGQQSVSAIDLVAYLRSLAHDLAMAHDTAARKIAIAVGGDAVRVELTQAVPLGLIMNEALLPHV